MPDPLRAETVRLKDGRSLLLRMATVDDAVPILENINLVCKEEVYVLMDEVPNDLERERAWLGSFDHERNVLFVAVHDGRIVGQADCMGGTVSKNRHTGMLGIAIRDGWRDAGLGRYLLGRVLEWMRSRGFEKAYLDVFSTNGRARRLYESLGFRSEGARKGQFKMQGQYVDDVIMGLWLT